MIMQILTKHWFMSDSHGNIEHDASISRVDFALGDNARFNETVFTTLAESNPGDDHYNTTSAGQVQYLRLADSQANNPNVPTLTRNSSFEVSNQPSTSVSWETH